MFFLGKYGKMGKHIEDTAQSDSEGCQKQLQKNILDEEMAQGSNGVW